MNKSTIGCATCQCALSCSIDTPMSFFRPKFSNLWAQYRTNKFLIVRSSHSNTIWHLVRHNNTVVIIHKIIICFTLDCGSWNFFGCSKVCDFQMLLWDFNSCLKYRIRVSLIAIIQFKNFFPHLDHFKCSGMILRCVCFCATVNACGTHYTATFFLNKCSVKIQWTVACGIPVSASISLTITRRSLSKYYVDDSNASIVDCYRGSTEPRIVICAYSPFPETFMP